MWALLTSSQLFLLIPSRLTCHLSKLFSTVFISSEHWSTFLISLKFVSTHLSCSARQKSLSVREKSLAQKKRLGAETFAHRSLRHRCIYTKNLYKILCTTKKACTKHFPPVLLCTTNLAQSTSQYYFVLRSLHKALPSTTLYYKACTKHLPVLLCTTKLAQGASQYYFVLHSLHKALPSTTLYYKACTQLFPVLLCTTKLAQSRSQYYFVLQSLHKALPSTTLYHKACTEYFAVLLCTTKLAQKPLVAEHRGGNNSPIGAWTTAAATAAHTRYLASPAAATLHGKTDGFVLRLPPQNKAHATFMQPVQCVSQHHVANLHAACIYAHGNTRWQQPCSHYTSVLLCDVKSHTTLHWVYCYR